ncbi:MAG: peptide/nickel transport system substrate-binding protein [Planctomycetota bacterium]|jgi:peptide/nickel transport system substrate-binding protein
MRLPSSVSALAPLSLATLVLLTGGPFVIAATALPVSSSGVSSSGVSSSGVSFGGTPVPASPSLGGGGGGFLGAEEGAEGAEATRVAPQDTPAAPTPQVAPQVAPVIPDLFHPENQPGPDGQRSPAPAPRRGGSVVLQMNTRPSSLNRLVNNSHAITLVSGVTHETLVGRDRDTWEYRSLLASEWTVEDRVHLQDSAGVKSTLVGTTSQVGDELVITPRPIGGAPRGQVRVPRSQVLSVDQAVVHTFQLRDDIVWHDGHPFDVNDVYFSWSLYSNPTVDCEHDRDEVAVLETAVILDERTIRFEGSEQYFAFSQSLGSICLVPSHRYNLSDPDNDDFTEDSDPLGERQGRYVNEHPLNAQPIGLGPYRITSVGPDHVEVQRFDEYFEPDPLKGHAGWLDTIRWRVSTDRGSALTALLEGELDYYEGLSSSDYYGSLVSQEAFVKRLYAAYAYRPQFQYVPWNMRKPHLADVRVRRALAHACDWQAFLDGQAHGLGVRVTGSAYHESPSYDQTIEPLAFDPELAEELLDEAGWYDRDGDGLRDKDGQTLSIEFLANAGGGVSNLYARVLQEGLARVGVDLNVVKLDDATLHQRLQSKDFEATSRAWYLGIENDPIQLWGRWKGDPEADRSPNYPGWGDAESDALIERIRRCVDDQERWGLMRELQRRIHAEQPYLFLFDFPAKFAVAQRIRGFKSYGQMPGYSPLDWYIVED